MKQTEGQIFAEARQRKGITQAVLADKLGFTSPQFISNVERDKARLPKSHLRATARLLGRAAIERLIETRAKRFEQMLKEKL